MKKRTLLSGLFCALGCIAAFAQSFRNLTAREVRIDDALPVVSQTFAIDNANGSYYVSLDYPEYIDMTASDIKRIEKLTCEKLPPTPHIDINIGVERKKASLTASFVPIVFKDGRWKKIVSFKLTLHTAAMSKAKAATASAQERYASHSVLGQGRWAKIRVAESGIHELTAAVARKAGFNDLSRVRIYGYGGALQPEMLTDNYLRSTDDLKEVASCMSGGKRLFYAQGPISWTSNGRTRNPYSDYGYYFLTESDTAVDLTSEADFMEKHCPIDNNALYERDDFAWYHGGRNLYDSQLFGNGISRDYSLKLKKTPTTGKLTVVLSADKATTATVKLNGETLGSVSIASGGGYDYAKTSTKTFNITTESEQNTVSIQQTGDGNMRLDYIALQGDAAADKPDLATATVPAAEFDCMISNQDLHADAGIDMVIVVPQSQKWTSEAERLKDMHERRDGMRVKIVAEDQLWNEFSSGTPDATALRRYMKMLYDRASTEADMPKHLLLFGDGAWDNRMLTTEWKGENRNDFLLCFESENSLSAVSCFVTDDFYTMLDDEEQLSVGTQYTGKPDVAVGRLTARTAQEAKTMVDKIINYTENGEPGTWRNTLVFMGDDGNKNIHMQDADDAAEAVRALAPAMDIKKVIWDAYKLERSSTGNSYPDVTKLLRQQMQKGALLMNYSGHGRADCLSHEYVLRLVDFKSIKTSRLPVWITASCDIMPFDGQEENIGETAMSYGEGGAIAFFGTTRTVYADRNRYINQATLKHLFTKDEANSMPTLGEAIRKAKVELASTYTAETGSALQDLTVNKLQYVLLGDPALKLPCPNMAAEVDSINGQAISAGNTTTLKAGETVRISGRIKDNNATATDFNGQINATVKGAKETITCRMNNTTADGTDWAFKYVDRTSVLFRGNDSIRNGLFNIEFVVPKDIVYSENTGQILLYGMDANGRQANGEYEGIAFNGTALDRSDAIGPSIYCYLNSSAFVNGDMVNHSPYFIAELNDESGINATGTGIGHDLQLTIDDDPNKSYTLNDYFTFDFGSYQSGMVGFQIPELSEGDHHLTFRAWDIYNNSSTASLNFTVGGNATPKVLDIVCTKNPASTSTSFRIIHDRIGCDMDVTIDIYDMAGRKIWSKQQNETPASNTISIDWDLNSAGGSRIGNGIYLYRVKMSNSEGVFTSNAKKLIILSNK